MFKFSPEQINSLFIKIGNSHLKMTRFCLGDDQDLSQVPPQLLVSAFSRLESVQLFGRNHITGEQFAAIFTMLASQELAGSKLKSLYFYNVDELSSVSPEVLVEAIRRLKEFELLESTLTADQINAILTVITERREGMLKTIKIEINNEDIVGTVSQTLLESAKQMKDLLEIEISD